MKRIFLSSLLALAVSPLFAATNVGVSVSIGQPDFFGHIEIGNAPAPQVIFAEPIVVIRSPRPAQPLYLRVPPGHEKKWSKHCKKYNACGRPVYFVRDEWYREVYAPHYHEMRSHRGHDEDRDDGHGHKKEKHKGKHKDKNKGHD